MLKLAYQYMRYYKSQTCAILLSIILTAALLTGISSLLYSSQMNELENARLMYGEWHYDIHVDAEVTDNIADNNGDSGYKLEYFGIKIVKDAVTEPFQIYFVETDENYRKLSHRELIDGVYPEKEDEIAADNYTLGNLGFDGGLGDDIEIAGRTYTLVGIMKSEWSTNVDHMEVFVGNDFQGKGAEFFIYLKFNEKKPLYRQLDAFLNAFQISGDKVENNDEVIKYLQGEEPDSIYEIVKFGLTNEQGNFTYIVLKLQSEYNLAFHGMLALLCIFSLFIIYSVFNISVSKRIAQYGIMQAMGIEEKNILGSVIAELWILFCVGYPIGAFVSNGLLKKYYNQVGEIFGNTITNANETALASSEQTLAGSNFSDLFYISWSACISGFVILFIVLAGIGYLTVKGIRKKSLRETISEQGNIGLRNRRIYGFRRNDLSGIAVRKFMFGKKRKIIGILVSLSLGGCIFLCTTYMIENLKIHAEMEMNSDDGLNSEYRISLKSKSLADEISKEAVQTVKELPGLTEVYATKYTLGEITIGKEELEWDSYFNEYNQDSGIQNDYGGICVEKDGQNYGIKYDIYGYDIMMMEILGEYILEGEIDSQDILSGNKVIAVANVDGQGNYNFYGKHPGDTIKVKVPKDQKMSNDVLKFESASDDYTEMDFKIAAIVSRPLVKEENFLIRGAWDKAPSIIMTNQQMQDNFDISRYKIISASKIAGTDGEEVTRQLLLAIQDIPKAVLQDYSAAIEVRKTYLRQQQMFFTCIAVILLIISLFHIINSMNYSILARRYEFGVLRAMGMTDIGLYKLIVREGMMYGVLANALLFFLYGAVLQKGMIYYMQHVVQFLHITASVPPYIFIMIIMLNIVIAVIAVILPARRIMRDSIIEEIRK